MQIPLYTVVISALLAGGTLAPFAKERPTTRRQVAMSCAPALVRADTSFNGQWYLQPVLASDTAAGKYPTITFNTTKGTFTGNTGCNRMSGSFQVTDTSLVLSDRIMLTKMLCQGYNEPAFMKTLLSTNRYRYKKEDSVLVLMFNQTELSRWTRKPYRAPIGKRT